MMKYRIVALLILLFCAGCEKTDGKEDLDLSSDIFNQINKQNYIISYFNFDCSACIAAMQRIDNLLKDYSNVYYIVSSTDSLRTFYYWDKMNSNAEIIFDPDAQFLKSNYYFDFLDSYPVFVKTNGILGYSADPFQNVVSRVFFRLKIRPHR